MSTDAKLTIVTIRLPICNAFLLKGTRAVLVDTGKPGDAPAIIRSLEKEGIGHDNLALIVQTHGHWDHCGSTREMKRWTKAPVAIHRGDVDMMRYGHNGVLTPATLSGRLLRRFLDRSFPGAEPDIVLEGEMDLSDFGVEARVVPTPGHTSGSMSLVTPGNEAIVGDLVMGGIFGGRMFPKRPNFHYFAEDFALLRGSLQGLLDSGVRTVHSGHGGPLEPARIRRRLLT